MRRVSAVLIHHPILDRERAVVTGAITNLDLHDISRSAHTYGLSAYYIAHPIAAQRELAARVREHWLTGSGSRRIPDRVPPMRDLRIVSSLDDALADSGPGTELWVTSANASGQCLGHGEARACLKQDGPPVLIVFGTGWGLADEVMQRATQMLAPIRSPREDGFNHLSVRAAAAIIFDRLLGPR
ncbi:MAG TPA: RNA methyltransferase [Polyangiaceae bacterium]|nr:RNA methyltransferase [Polyangiaceae bacterium]